LTDSGFPDTINFKSQSKFIAFLQGVRIIATAIARGLCIGGELEIYKLRNTGTLKVVWGLGITGCYVFD